MDSCLADKSLLETHLMVKGGVDSESRKNYALEYVRGLDEVKIADVRALFF
jgi:hypothetical protein